MPTIVSSPCVSICTLDAAGRRCLGCDRTLEEIAAWGTMSEAARRAVIARLAARRISEAAQ
ncbi:DUF1289 domain-containing protein [Ancylobacter sp. VNQ12]|uniref:DUF1289 domain-containing protein n=1 Tax=Ancylobacter sp. VNQ12 TaxID=3400920 RepID=UPI003C117A88